jgi:tRNA (guanine-N7-)-methyltransferase
MKPRYLSLAPLIVWRRSERPIDWSQHFGHAAPLDLEIGFGNGEFLVRQAQQHPDRHYVGIELEWASMQRGLRRIAQTSVCNVRLIQVDVRVALQRLFRPQCLARAYALFPCPWPKQRHVKYRLFSQPFLQLLNSRLLPGGHVQIVTDHRDYLDWVLDQVPGSGFDVRWRAVPAQFRTKYERKWQSHGQEQFYELSLRQQQYVTVTCQEDIAVQTHSVASFMPESFQPTGRRGDIAVEFKHFLFDPARHIGMVRVLTTEEQQFKQDFWIEIVQRDGAWSIRPAPGCSIVPTMGVQLALDCVRDAILHGPSRPESDD